MPILAPDLEKGLRNHTPLPPNAFASRTPQDSALSTPARSLKNVPPLKTKPRASRMIQFQLWFNTYRKFYTLTVTLNLIGLLLAATGTWQYPRRYTGAFVLGNLQCAILMRNELFGRFLYLVVNTLFAKWPPLWFRLGWTSALQHLGGIHSGCAVSGAAWLVFRVVMIIADYRHFPASIIATGVVTSVAVFISIASALPWVRDSHHNIFEGYHRMVGWLGLVSTWIFVVLGDSYDITTHSWHPDGIRLAHQQDFWFVAVMSVLVILPWLRFVKYPSWSKSRHPRSLSYASSVECTGALGEDFTRNCPEYHAFGIISKGRQANEHYLICGVQGDFTQSLVDHPPTHLWTRQLKFAGVSNTSKLYKRGIRVCTGTGLGAALSTCLQSPDWFLIWMGSDQAKTFGSTISALIHDNLPPEQYILWDSKERGGRPDVMKLIKETYISWGAEVVFITSNMVLKLLRRVIPSLTKLGRQPRDDGRMQERGDTRFWHLVGFLILYLHNRHLEKLLAPCGIFNTLFA
ncbi:hypothetical protein B0H13DRAFT_2652929 [Mycena leptocephala]|nr:hypothetical protein B0H13DRAFT_2652929 [Mycena leptocephala]